MRIEGRDVVAVLKTTWREMGEDKVSVYAAQMAYAFFFSLFPLLLFFAALFSLVADKQTVQSWFDTRLASALPGDVAFADAAYSAGRAALLGAALAAGDPALLAASAGDRLHEPYRAANAPHLVAIRADLPRGALGAALSGSGPTVVVWAERDRAGEVAVELAERYPEHEILHLPVATAGAGPA